MSWPEAVVACVSTLCGVFIVAVFITGEWPWSKRD